MQKVWKMMPKCIQNGSQKRTKNWKYQKKKKMQEIEAENWCQKDAGRKGILKVFGGFWVDVLGGPGGRGEDFIAYISADIYIIWHARPRRGAADQKSHPKSMPKPSKNPSKKRCEKRVKKRGSVSVLPPKSRRTRGSGKRYKKAHEERHIQRGTYRDRHTRPSNTPRAPSGPERIYLS